MTREPSIAVIIVIWNGKVDTVECLESLERDLYRAKEIIVVDNGSTDDSVDEIRRRFPMVTIIQTGHNLGFTGGNNEGIRYALERGVDYVYLLNNDTTVEPDALDALVRVADAQPDFGLLAPVMHHYDPPRGYWFAGSKIDLLRGQAWHDNSRAPGRHDVPYEVPWVTGCAFLVSSERLREVGLFDDRYYLSWEDVDLSLRMRDAGYKVVAVPAARIYHKGGRSGDRMPESKFYYSVRNKLLLVRKRNGHVRYLYAACHIVADALWPCLHALRRRTGEFGPYLNAVFAGIRDHLTGKYGERAV